MYDFESQAHDEDIKSRSLRLHEVAYEFIYTSISDAMPVSHETTPKAFG